MRVATNVAGLRTRQTPVDAALDSSGDPRPARRPRPCHRVRRAGATRPGRRGAPRRRRRRAAAQPRARRLRHQRRAAHREEGGRPAARARRAGSPTSWPRQDGIASAEIAGPRLHQPAPRPPTRRAGSWPTSSRAARPTVTATTTRAATSTWSSSPPTRPARCTSAAPAGPRSATRWAGCSPRRAPRSSASTTSTTPAARSTGSSGRWWRPPAASRCPRTATAAPTSARSPRRVVAAEPECAGLPDADRDEIFRRIGVGLMFDEIKAALHAFGTDFDVYFHEESLHDSGRGRGGRRAAQGLRQPLLRRTAPGGSRSTDYGDDKDRVGHQVGRQARLHRGRHRLLPRQARPRLRPVHLHARRRPPRLHRPAEGGRGGPRRRPGGGRGADRADGQPGPGRRAGADEQARGHGRHAWTTWSRRSAWTRPGTR